MLTVIACLVIVILKAEGQDIDNYDYQEIRLNAFSEKNIYVKYTILKNKPLSIVLENYYPSYVWCNDHYYFSGYKIPLIKRVAFYNNVIAVMNISSVTDEMSTRWACTVLQHYNGSNPTEFQGHTYTAQYLYFNVHVKGAKQVNLSVNGMDLIPVMTNLSVMEYDGETHYTYVDGEVVDLFCNATLDGSSLRLNYYDARGYQLIQTDMQTSKPHNFRSMLTLKNINSYIDCIYTSKDHREDYCYRTTFILKKEDLDLRARQDTLIVYVNGLKLVPMPSTDNDTKQYYDKYQYKYIEGDVLNITCQKSTENMKGRLDCLYNKDINVSGIRDDSTRAIKVSLNASHLNIQKRFLICQDISHTQAYYRFAAITFMPDLQPGEPRLLGLNSKNVEYQYSYDENQWTIVYQGTVNETLNLTCILKRSQGIIETDKLQWEFAEEIIDFPQNLYPPLLIQDTRLFAINERHNHSRIKCVSKKYNMKRTVELILHLKPLLPSDTALDQVSIEDIVPESTGFYSTYLIAILFVIILIILMVLQWFCCKKCYPKESALPPMKIDPDTVFYVNLLNLPSVFREPNEREAREMEHHYEPIS